MGINQKRSVGQELVLSLYLNLFCWTLLVGLAWLILVGLGFTFCWYFGLL
jgi:hypothetical protein